MTTKDFMPILFSVLFAFVAFNMLVNFTLLLLKRNRIYKVLSVFWPSVLLAFIFQSQFQEEPLSIALAYSANYMPMAVISMIGFEALGRKYPLKHYLILCALSYPFVFLLHAQGYGFTVYALPVSLVTLVSLAHTFLYLSVIDRKKSTKLQKLLGVVVLLMGLHSINFAVFRLDPDSQLWGWMVAYALYDFLAILLPSIALEEANLHENERLQRLVQEKTAKLSLSLKQNEDLLRVLLHDIANPLSAMRYFVGTITPREEQEVVVSKITRSVQAMEEILSQVKMSYMQNKKPFNLLKPVALDECLSEVSFMFAQSLESKRVSLKIDNQLGKDTKVLAEKSSLTHSVLSNLVSNGLKFSHPDSEIGICVRESAEGTVILEVIDQGPGIPQQVIDSLMNEARIVSTEGTSGEQGNGFGLSIVKAYVESYGGQIHFQSQHLAPYFKQQGTKVQITLEKS